MIKQKSKYNSLGEWRENDNRGYQAALKNNKLFKICKTLGWIINKKKSYDALSIEECIKLGKKHKITSATMWIKKYKEISEKENKKLPSYPWEVFDLEGGANKFSELLGCDVRLYDVSSNEECIKLGKKHKITSAGMWIKKHKEIGEKENKKLPSQPWDVFNLEGGFIRFSELLGCDVRLYDVSSNRECIKLGKKHKITSAKMWIRCCKEISEKENKKLPSQPWDVFNLEGGATKFSELLGYVKCFGVSSIEECIKLGKKHKITSAGMWIKKYKEIGEKENKKLPSRPWAIFNLEGGAGEFSLLLKSNKKK